MEVFQRCSTNPKELARGEDKDRPFVPEGICHQRGPWQTLGGRLESDGVPLDSSRVMISYEPIAKRVMSEHLDRGEIGSKTAISREPMC